MKDLIRSVAKKVPGLRPLVITVRQFSLRQLILWCRFRELIYALRPMATDKELIRLGPSGDGGYLVPADLDGIIACFSPGVGSISGFEMDCAKLGMEVFLADASVDAPDKEHDLFNFTKAFIGGSTSGDYITLNQWVSQSIPGKEGDLILQMDIEGYEYDVLQQTQINLLERFRIIVVEFHDLQEMTKQKYQVLKKLLKTHLCVHIHPNNYYEPVQLWDLTIPRYMEFTFLRRDRVNSSKLRTEFPHPLDADNTSNKPLPLPRCWYG